MSDPTFTPPPTAPARLTDTPANFVAKADAFVAWFATLYTELVAFVTWCSAAVTSVAANAASALSNAQTAQSVSTAVLGASNYIGTSSASVSIGSGSKAFTSVSGASAIVTGDDVTAFSRSNPGNRIRGTATVSGSTITISVGSTGYSGSGTVSDWVIVSTWFATMLSGVAADLRLGTSYIAGMSPGAIYDALAEVSLTDAATIAVDMSTFVNATVTLGGNRTLGNPTNPKPGQTGRISVIQDGTGNRTLAMGSNWKRSGGAPTFSTAAGAIDIIEYDVRNSSYILYDVILNPS